MAKKSDTKKDKKKDDIKIKPSKEGSFTAIAKRDGGIDKETGKIKESFIDKELHSKDPKVRKKANFAKNARKWKH